MSKEQKPTKLLTFQSFIIDKKLYITNYSLSYSEIFKFFFPLNNISIVEYNNKLVCFSTIDDKSYQNNFFLKNFDKIELVTIIGGG